MERIFGGRHRCPPRLRNSQLRREEARIDDDFRHVNGASPATEQIDTGLLERLSQIDRGLSAELRRYRWCWSLLGDSFSRYVQDGLGVQRLKVQTRRGIEVCTHRLRVVYL